MKEIDLSALQVGQVTDREYYTEQGDLLLSNGMRLTQQHLNALQRRNIAKVYFQEHHDNDELNQILSKEFHSLSQIPLDDRWDSKQIVGAPGLEHIKAGREGFIQLMKSTRGSELDQRLKEGRSPDKPAGPQLSATATQITAKERTDTYRSDIQTSYDDALRQTKQMLDSLVSGESVEATSLRSLVDSFVTTFLTDRDILLNLAGSRSRQEEYVYSHSLNVCLLAINIAASHGYNREQVTEIGMGALLHDVGMLLIPNSVRLKKGRLSEDEWYEVQKHPVLGLHLLEKITRLPEAVPFVAYQCHERENGKGYPKQRSSRLIHNYAKVITVADIYEALCSPRSYRDANMPYKAMEMIIKMTRQGLISGEFVKAFLKYTSLFPVGSTVELSNGCVARVVRANSNSFAKPTVCVTVDANGRPLPKDRLYEEDLALNTSLQIVKAHYSDSAKSSIMLGF